MLPRIVLIALQIGIGFLVGGWIADALVRSLGVRDLDVVIYGLVYGVVVWLVGLAGAGVLKGMRSPTFLTFLVTLVGAMLLAVLLLIPPIRDGIGSVISFRQIPATLIPLLGAVIGYLVS